MFRLATVVVLLVASCGSSGGEHTDASRIDTAQVDTPGGGGSTTYLYLPGDSGITAFKVDSSGALTQIDEVPGGTVVDPAPTGGNSMSIAIHPNKKFLYTSNYTNATISAFSIDGATGLLTKLDGDPGTPGVQDYPSGGSGTAWVAMDPLGRVVYVSQSQSAQLSTFAIDSATGALTAMGSVTVTSTPRGIAVDPQARTLAVIGYTSPGKITMCTLDATTGLPTPIDADGLTGGRQDFAADANPAFAAMDHTGTHLFVPAVVGNKVDVYTVSPTTAVLTPGATPSAVEPVTVALTSDDKFLFVSAAGGAGSVDDFSVAQDGTPTPIASSSYPSPQPRAFGFDPTNHFLYVTDDNNAKIFRYQFDASSGALSDATSYDAANSGGYNMVIVAY